MTRPRNIHAIATKASIDAVLATAEQLGELITRHESETACIRFRNALYKRRARERKNAAELLGVSASPLDRFSFRFHPEEAPAGSGQLSGKWLFIISYEDAFKFEVLLPKLSDEEYDALPYFDIPQAPDEGEEWV